MKIDNCVHNLTNNETKKLNVNTTNTTNLLSVHKEVGLRMNSVSWHETSGFMKALDKFLIITILALPLIFA